MPEVHGTSGDHALEGLRSASGQPWVRAPRLKSREGTWGYFIHAGTDGWTHEAAASPTGTGILRMTGPDGRSGIFMAHDVDERGRRVIRSFLGETPFEGLAGLTDLAVSKDDPRTMVNTIMMTALGDLLALDQESEYAAVFLTWSEEGPCIQCSRDDPETPWPKATDRMTGMLASLGPMHRLAPCQVPQLVTGILPEPPYGIDAGAVGLTLDSSVTMEAEMRDAVERLRTMAACDAARSRLHAGTVPFVTAG